MLIQFQTESGIEAVRAADVRAVSREDIRGNGGPVTIIITDYGRFITTDSVEEIITRVNQALVTPQRVAADNEEIQRLKLARSMVRQ